MESSDSEENTEEYSSQSEEEHEEREDEEDENDEYENPFDNYQLLEKIGEGAYAEVFKAKNKKTMKDVAIKIMPSDIEIEEILNEINTMKQCNSPYIVSYHTSFFQEEELWIVMEYCSGGSVKDFIKILERGMLEEEVAVIVKDVLKGLEYLHGIDQIHRDIKCGNILLDMDGHSKLADLGVAGSLEGQEDHKRRTMIGTPFWMAPEVIQEKGYDCTADIWSLGISILEMVERKVPYQEFPPMKAIFMISNNSPPFFEKPENYSEELQSFVKTCLNKNPEQRETAKNLVKHSFILQASPPSILVSSLRDIEEKIRTFGREKLLFKESES